jgi:hypothetical protein
LNVPFGFELDHFTAQPLDLQLLGLHLALAGEGLGGISRKILHPLPQRIHMHIQIPRGLRHRHAPFSDQLTASSLNSRLNFRRCITHLRFHHDT